jgi:hypothetical protein
MRSYVLVPAERRALVDGFVKREQPLELILTLPVRRPDSVNIIVTLTSY